MTARSLPAGYVQIDRWTLGGASGWMLLAVAAAFLVLAYVSVAVISLVHLALKGSASFTVPGEVLIPGSFAGIVVGIVLHELGHVIAVVAFCARPGFGFKPWVRIGPVFWVSAPGCYLNRAEFATVALLPPVLLSALLPIALFLVPAGGLVYTTAGVCILLRRIRVGRRRCHAQEGHVVSTRCPFRGYGRWVHGVRGCGQRGDEVAVRGPKQGPSRNYRDWVATCDEGAGSKPALHDRLSGSNVVRNGRMLYLLMDKRHRGAVR